MAPSAWLDRSGLALQPEPFALRRIGKKPHHLTVTGLSRLEHRRCSPASCGLGRGSRAVAVGRWVPPSSRAWLGLRSCTVQIRNCRKWQGSASSICCRLRPRSAVTLPVAGAVCRPAGGASEAGWARWGTYGPAAAETGGQRAELE